MSIEFAPCIGKEFIENVRQLLLPRFRRRLRDLEDFRFQRDPLYNLSSERLELLVSIINKKDSETLALQITFLSFIINL